MQQLGADNIRFQEGEEVVKKRTVCTQYMRFFMIVQIKSNIMNRKKPEQKIVTPEMNIAVFFNFYRIECFFQFIIGRFPGEKNKFLPIRNAFQDIQMNTLRTTD